MLLTTVQIFTIICFFFLATTTEAAERLKRVKSEPAQAPAPVATPVTILSIIPAQAEPGAKIVLSGTGFGEKAAVFLGSVEIAVRTSDAKIIEFTVPPQLEAGIYALYLKRSDGMIGRSYNFTVLPLRPVLTSLNPAQLSFCASGKEREVAAIGSNFGESSMLFFDGAALNSTLVSSETLSFTVPPVPGGLHQVLVKNSPENGSASLALVVETRPEIGQVSVGNEYVNYYELIITGRNFSQNSSMYVDGVQIGGRGQEMTDREKLLYVDCTKMIYQRHPYSSVKKDFRLQIVNSGGEGSQVITVSAP
ncbi:MAG TPA: transcription factor [Desulfuromonadales bacterium]|nr:transcription factor [Desulfuromonadales bacterium]